MQEAVVHYGESIKDIINEEFGDGMYVGNLFEVLIWFGLFCCV